MKFSVTRCTRTSMSAIDGSVSRFRAGRSGFFGDNMPTPNTAGGAGSISMDSSATPSYPTQPAVDGVWYGVGTQGQAAARGPNSTVLGNGALLTGTGGTAVGQGASAGLNGLALGRNASSQHPGAIALGLNANAHGNSNIALGPGTTSTGGNSIAVGINSTANADNTIAVGNSTNAITASSTCLGSGATSANVGDLCLGIGATAVVGGPNLNIVVADAVVTAALGASDRYLRVRINGVNYNILLHT